MVAKTGITSGLPKGSYARIAPSSGLGSKKGISINGGVIDADYIWEMKVIMVNHGNAHCRIQPSDRIAQVIVEQIDNSDIMEVDDLEITERADMGFRSADLSPPRVILVAGGKPIISFLQANHKNNEYFDA